MTAYIVSSGIVSSGLTLGPLDTLTVLAGGTASALPMEDMRLSPPAEAMSARPCSAAAS